MKNIAKNFKKGVSEIVVLKLLSDNDMYGYELTRKMKACSDGKFIMPEGSLYPTLYRLIKKGVISDRQEIVNKRLRKYYHMEESGKEYLQQIIKEYRDINKGVDLILTGGDENGEI